MVSGAQGKGPRVSPSKRHGNTGVKVRNKYKPKMRANDDSDVIPGSDTEVEIERNKGNVL